ncbi:DNA cytosine methyltransferase [Desertibaculum subflavum]|uniref:DNA cytosine methyltransferase n=1 Tax=Desertibaculum subflavum TaxID=2268458 RepID=UPI000E67021C
MKVAGLFAGIGGFELGLSRSGHEAQLLCEIWSPAQSVLRARYPGIPLVSDVTTLNSLPCSTDAIVAGFPCQDLSQAGHTLGIDGSRSGLVGHVFRLLDSHKVPVVVLENVSFMLHLGRGKALSTIIDAFEERGYRWAYRVVNSLAFLPQRRERVLFVATRRDVEIDPADIILADERSPPKIETSLDTHGHGFYWTEGIRGLGWAPDAIPTLKNGSTVGIASPPAILLPDGRVILPDIRDAERLQGFEPNWTEPAETVARPSMRWSLAGNAVTVPIAEWLGGRLAQPGHYDRSRDDHRLQETKWPRAARLNGAQRVAVRISAFPDWRPRPAIHHFLQHPGRPLSARATRGFLSRTERSTLRFADGFLERLRVHLSRMEAVAESPRPLEKQRAAA